MNYLLPLNGRYYYNRRVPLDLKDHDSRVYVRAALKTDSKKEALRLIGIQNAQVEAYWTYLIESHQKHTAENWKAFNRPVRLARFTTGIDDPVVPTAPAFHATAVMSNNKAPPSTQSGEKVMMSNCLEKYWRFEKPRTLNKSANQIRKWENPRKLAMKNFITCIGDKPVAEIDRDDMLAFREWWMERMNENQLTAATVNKNLVHVKAILESISDNMKLGLDIKHLFRKMLLADDDERWRLPFETDFIINTLLNPCNLKGLNDQAKWVLHAIAETGAGIAEQVGLMPEDIILDHDVPHIVITPRQKQALKTKYRKRVIPLTGYALDAFRACPEGFTHYRGKPDTLSAALSGYLKDNDLLPSDKHTVYSLRHSFQDRLLAVNAPDRVQADLMGHKFNRPAYGDGSSLKQKLEWLEKIQLKKPLLKCEDLIH